jgi:hypothetical protein
MPSFYRYIIGLLLILIAGCSGEPRQIVTVEAYPDIYPDYMNVTIPVNIAPLNFRMKEKCRNIEVELKSKNRTVLVKSDYKISIPQKKWKHLLEDSKNDSISLTVTAFDGSKWHRFKPFSIYVSDDKIDPFLSYRLIEPGYEVWKKLTICQRNLTTFDEKVLIDNNLIDGGCVNCHTYAMNDPGLSFFHLRHREGGTIIQKQGRIRKIDTRTDSTISAGVYGSWHPGGRYIAFSTNVIIPEFHSINNERLEVYDTISDVVVLDTEKDLILTSKLISAKSSFETFPVFSADGRKLYFCSAKAVKMPENYKSARYSLCSIDFDPEKGAFGNKTDTLVSASATGRSVSEPKTSPDGRYLLFTSIGYGNFPVWHSEADLHLMDLSTESIDSLKIVNSSRSDSWHCWSSSGRWFVFASKRDEGMYGKPYFSHVDKNGKAAKPFLLPQKDPDFYEYFLKSYNIPELSKGPAPFNAHDIEHAFRKLKAEKVSFASR